jgi:hypothetical protein
LDFFLNGYRIARNPNNQSYQEGLFSTEAVISRASNQKHLMHRKAVATVADNQSFDAFGSLAKLARVSKSKSHIKY